MDNYHNDYNHLYDAINIANGNPQYIGSGILAPVNNRNNTDDRYNYKSSNPKINKIIIFIVFMILVLVNILDYFNLFGL